MDQQRLELEQQKLLQADTQLELEKTQKQLQKVTKLQVKKWYDTEHLKIATKILWLPLVEQKTWLIEKVTILLIISGYMLYTRKCYNCDLTEKVLHHIG